MLIELKKLTPMSQTFALGSIGLSRMKKRFTQTKKRSRNLIRIAQVRLTLEETTTASFYNYIV